MIGSDRARGWKRIACGEMEVEMMAKIVTVTGGQHREKLVCESDAV